MKAKPIRSRAIACLQVTRPVECLATLLAAVAAACALAGCGQGPENVAGPPTKVVVAAATVPGSAALYVAQDRGYFRDAGLDVTLKPYDSGVQALAAMLAGEADLSTATETPIVRALLRGDSLGVLATVCRVDRAISIVARKDRGIAEAEDLRGKSVGVVAGSAADFFLHVYATTNGMRPAELHVVDLPADSLVVSLVRGDVDAISVWEPLSVEAEQGLGADAVVLEAPDLYDMMWNIAAPEGHAGLNPETARRFLLALVRANEFIDRNPGPAQVTTARAIAMNLDELKTSWSNYELEVTLDQNLLLSLEDQARWMMARQGMTGRPPDFLDCLYPAPLARVKPEAVTLSGWKDRP